MINEPSISNYTPEQQARALDWIIHDLRMEKPMGTTTAEMPDFGMDADKAARWLAKTIDCGFRTYAWKPNKGTTKFVVEFSGDNCDSISVRSIDLNTAVRMAMAAWRAREEA